MRARAQRIEVWGSAFLASVGLSIVPLAGCSSTVTDDGAGGEGSGSLVPCEEATPILVGDFDTGFVSCKGGWSHRASKVTCESGLPRPEAICQQVGTGGGTAGGCVTDADCSDMPYGHCNDDSWGGCYCSSGCVSDADCGEGQVCSCGAVIGTCVQASCTEDADCGGDKLCSSYITEPGCGGTAYQCQSTGDECGGDADCADNEQCSAVGPKKVCLPIECAIGRPFVVDGAERLPPVSARTDWSAEGLAPSVAELSSRTRAKLGDYWTTIGQMEHASIAAFARFTLQMLALGAPPELIVRSQSAMADETRHARLAFALASEYLGKPVGPGPLDMSGVLAEDSLEHVLRTVILEGCVGETVAAMEAKEALEYVTDPALRFVFGEVARDESEHALLAWRAVGWMCETFGQRALGIVGEVVDDVRAGLAGLAHEEADAHDEALLALGYVSSKVRSELRRGALERVVLRGLEALVCGAAVESDLQEDRMTLV